MRQVNDSVYNIIAEMGMPNPDIPVYEVEHYSQCGEDIIVLALLENIAEKFNIDLSKEKYLEIGANHPVATSASYLLNKKLKMSGVLVEANPSLLTALNRFRPDDVTLNVAVHASDTNKVTLYVSNQNEISSLEQGFVAQWADGKVGIREEVVVDAIRINDLIAENFIRCPIFISVDVEGIDLEILNDLNWNVYRPAVIQVEPSDHYRPGNTEEITACFNKNGYVVICRTSVNLIAVDIQRFLTSSKMKNTDTFNQLNSIRELAALELHELKVKYKLDDAEKAKIILNLQDQIVVAWKNNNDLQERFDTFTRANDGHIEEFARIIATYGARKKSIRNKLLVAIRCLRSEGYRLVSKSPLFDEDYYLREYPDVALSKMDPIKHYLKYGASEGRNPSSFFQTNAYLAANSDVANAGVNPLLHFLMQGFKEGRKIST